MRFKLSFLALAQSDSRLLDYWLASLFQHREGRSNATATKVVQMMILRRGHVIQVFRIVMVACIQVLLLTDLHLSQLVLAELLLRGSKQTIGFRLVDWGVIRHFF